MAVFIQCADPQGLLEKLRAAIKQGKIETWTLDGDGDLTHSPQQWRLQAWFRPVIETGKLCFYILGTKNKRMTKSIYGVYHGRLIEMLLTHFDNDFEDARATALAQRQERVGPPR